MDHCIPRPWYHHLHQRKWQKNKHTHLNTNFTLLYTRHHHLHYHRIPWIPWPFHPCFPQHHWEVKKVYRFLYVFRNVDHVVWSSRLFIVASLSVRIRLLMGRMVEKSIMLVNSFDYTLHNEEKKKKQFESNDASKQGRFVYRLVRAVGAELACVLHLWYRACRPTWLCVVPIKCWVDRVKKSFDRVGELIAMVVTHRLVVWSRRCCHFQSRECKSNERKRVAMDEKIRHPCTDTFCPLETLVHNRRNWGRMLPTIGIIEYSLFFRLSCRFGI